MKQYHFKKVFVRYLLLLTAIVITIYAAIIVIFNWQVNQEISESAEIQINDLKKALNQDGAIESQTAYFIMKHDAVLENHTQIPTDKLYQMLSEKKTFIYSYQNNRYHMVHIPLQTNQTLYYLDDVTDYEETKTLLFQLLLVLLCVTFTLMIATAYYIAIKPIRTYEQMINQHKEFIQNASHELKTPLASISLGVDYVTLMEHDTLTDKSRTALQKIKREIAYAQSLILNTLQITKYEKVTEPINIAHVLDDVIAQQEALHHVTITKDYAEDLWYPLSDTLLKQMMTILVDNAIKHNEDVTVTISASVQKYLTIVVSDNGKGIDARDMEHIFERYYRGDAISEGNGIGLSLLKEMITMINGEVTVQSERNKKTSFILKFF